MFHYAACGLPNVYLVNGFTETTDAAGERFFKIDNIKGLHLSIGMLLVDKESLLVGDEFRFLRDEMLMSRKALAHLLDISTETIKKWESGENPIPKSVDMVLRSIYKEFHNQQSDIRQMIDKINHDERACKELRFEETDGGWRRAAKA